MQEQLELPLEGIPDLTDCLSYQYSCAPAVNGVYTTMYVRDWTGPRLISSDGRQFRVGEQFKWQNKLCKVREVNPNIMGTEHTEIFAEEIG